MKTYNLQLDQVDVFQILDALRSRAESWERTVQYFQNDETLDDFGLIEKCSDENEATEIATHYRDIISNIESQT